VRERQPAKFFCAGFSEPARLRLEKGLRQEFEENCIEAEEKVEQLSHAVEKAKSLKKERGQWLKDQLEWTRVREAMQRKIAFLLENSNAETRRADAAEGEAAGLKEQLSAAEAKAVRLEQELFGANAKILEEQQERLTVMRAQASSAAQAAIQQSKQFDRGKLDVRVNS
jgi:chromosome segregation ATPase